MSSIATLLAAAEYLERREREAAEHGYASHHPSAYIDDLLFGVDSNSSHGSLSPTNTSITNNSSGSKKSKMSKKSQGNRTTHNELEKNRRAHLRGCLEQLKNMVPLGADSSRHTTLGLLNKARCFIRNLEERDRKHRLQKEQLAREQRTLLRRLDQLASEASRNNTKAHRFRSISESSSGISSSASTSPTNSAYEDME